VGNWYRVTKRINGRLYASSDSRTTGFGPGNGVTSPSAATISASAPHTPEDAIWHLNPVHNPDGIDLRRYEKQRQQEIWDNEAVKYGPVKARLKRQEAQVRAAKRKTTGIQAENPFLAQALKTNKSTAPKRSLPPEKHSSEDELPPPMEPRASITRTLEQSRPTDQTYPPKSTSFSVSEKDCKKHDMTYSPDADPSRGRHAGYCRHCGMNMSYDSSD
jgi:hypothetical protein